MSGFPLYKLNSTCLGGIFSKVETRSYFRLQQTCRDMRDIVRNKRNLITFFPGFWNLLWEIDNNGNYQLRMTYNKYVWMPLIHVDIKSIVGIRLERLILPAEITEKFHEFCSILKKHRITAQNLMYNLNCGRNTTKEQYKKLIRLVKPQKIKLDSRESRKFEELFLSTSIIEARIFINAGDVLFALPKFSSTIECLCLDLQDSIETYFRLYEPLFKFIVDIIKILCFNTTRRRGVVEITWSWNTRLVTADGLQQLFTDFSPNIAEPNVYYWHNRFILAEWSINGSNGSTCILNVYPFDVDIKYVG